MTNVWQRSMSYGGIYDPKRAARIRRGKNAAASGITVLPEWKTYLQKIMAEMPTHRRGHRH